MFLQGGILLGPSALGKTTYFADLFPTRSILTVETLGYMALVLHMFLVGLEVDLNAVVRITKKAVVVTVTGLFLPFITGAGFFYMLRSILDDQRNQYYHQECGLLWAASLTVTSYPAVGQILSDLKLLSSEIGRMAMPIALISDLGSWILVVILIPFCTNPSHAPVDCPELGVIGDLLAVSDSATSSVLVVKQFVDAVNNQVIEDLVGTQELSMDRTAMYFGSRRLVTATTNKLRSYSDSKEKPTTVHDHADDP
ncbi:hypothetical protein V6N13_093864 [Hibiscus sabdariffa]